jgi:hypothetical protein
MKFFSNIMMTKVFLDYRKAVSDLHPHYSHHDFSDEINWLKQVDGFTEQEALDFIFSSLRLDKENNPELYYDILNSQISRCQDCQGN